MLWLGAVAAGGLLLALVLVGIALRERRELWIRWRQPRYTLRVRARGQAGTHVVLGKIEEGSPIRVRSAALDLLDEMDRAVLLPAEQLLEIEAFEGALRDDGGLYRIPADERFWVLDAPGGPDVPADAAGRLHVPGAAKPYAVTTEARPVLRDARAGLPASTAAIPVLVAVIAAANADPSWPGLPVGIAVGIAIGVAAVISRARALARAPLPPAGAKLASVHGSATLCAMPAPLWVHGLRQAQEWLLGPKREGDTHVLVISALDEGAEPTTRTRNEVVGSVCHLLAEAVWTCTDLRARAVVPLVVGRERHYPKRFSKPGYEALREWARNYPGKRLVIRTEVAGERPLAGGFVLHLRFTEPADAKEHTLRGTLPALVPQMLAWIEQHWGARRDPPAGVAPPLPADDVAGWLSCLAAQERIALGKPESPQLPAPTAEEGDAGIERALAYADRHGDAMPQARLLAISMGIELEKHGLLGAERRARLSAMVESLAREGQPLARLAPGLLAGIGEHATGAERARAALAAMGGAYRAASDGYGAWLREIAAEPDALVPDKPAPRA